MGPPNPDVRRALRAVLEINNVPNSLVAERVFVRQLIQQWQFNIAVQQTLKTWAALEDLQRLTEISQSAQQQDLELDQVGSRIRDDTPFTGLIQFLPKNRVELYAFLALLVATLQLIVAMRSPDPVMTATPEQVQEVIEQVIDHVDDDLAPDPPPTKATRRQGR